MTRKRRFFIYFASFGMMSAFLLFTLSVRPDQPLKRWASWLPENKVIAMILELPSVTEKPLPKEVRFSDDALTSMKTEGITELEVYHNIREADVDFSHEKTKARATPKEYYLTEEINRSSYYIVVKLFPKYSEIIEFGSVKE